MNNRLQILALFLAGIMFCTCEFSLTARAEDAADVYQAEYDMAIGGEQQFTLINEDGETVNVTITEEPQTARLENRTYSVSYSSPLSWSAGYKIVVKNNFISSAHSPYHKAANASISNAKLTKESSKRVSYYFVWKYLSKSTNTGVRSVISNNKINVSVI